METTHCPVCAAAIPATQLEDHVAVIHPSVVDTEVAQAQASAHHQCPFCGLGLVTPESLKDHIATHGR